MASGFNIRDILWCKLSTHWQEVTRQNNQHRGLANKIGGRFSMQALRVH